jgi:hypothetical protein
MKQLTPEVLAEAVSLIDQIRGGELDDAAISANVVRIDALLLDPYWMAYAIDCEPELPAEQVVRRAFEYRPIILGGPSTQLQP